MKHRLFTLALLLSALYTPLAAQLFRMDGTDITTCTGTFYDSGGPDADYQPGENLQTLICAQPGIQSHIRLAFFELQIADDAQLRFFDGNSTDAPEILPSVALSAGLPFAIQSTAANTGGYLLVTFAAGTGAPQSGWYASINCTPPCQSIVSAIATDPGGTPAHPNFIDICPGDSVFFEARPQFPQNDLVYHQSADNSTYFWYFSDGTPAAGRSLTRTFDTPGSYRVRLDVRDDLGCPSSSLVDAVVRVSPGAALVLHADPDDGYCLGDTIVLHTAINLPADVPGISIHPNPVEEVVGQSVLDTILLPDGTGAFYTSSLCIDHYPPGLTFGDLTDFGGFFLNLEHSCGRDLGISITCPTQQEVDLLRFPSAIQSINFGEPFTASNDNRPGVPYTYTFVEDAPNGTLIEFEPTAPLHQYMLYGTLFHDIYFPGGRYSSQESLTNLNECPMNGEWTIRVTDNIFMENGWLFGWGIADSSGYNRTVLDSVYVESWGWAADASILLQTLDSIVVLPTNPGLNVLQFLVTDSFGCPNDTTFQLNILPEDDPACLVDTTDEAAPPTAWRIYPNPTNDVLHLVTPDADARWQYRVFNAQGQQIRSGDLRDGQTLPTSAWPAGMYLIQLDGGAATQRHTHTIVKM